MHERNHFLETLPAEAFELIRAKLELVSLKRDQRIVEVDKLVTHALLPVTSIISVISVMKNGDLVESRTIGREGGFGLLHALGSRMSFERVITQVAGDAYRISLPDLEEAAAQSPALTQAIVRHAQATIVQSAHFVACNSLHNAAPRLCRWLLMTQDRLGSDTLALTQEHLAIMLAVQRTTVTALAMALQGEGLVSYSRGKIRILDREGLERRSCECYRTLTRSVSQILREPLTQAGPERMVRGLGQSPDDRADRGDALDVLVGF